MTVACSSKTSRLRKAPTVQHSNDNGNGNRYVTYKFAINFTLGVAGVLLTVFIILGALYSRDQRAQDTLNAERWETHLRHEVERTETTTARLVTIENKLDTLRDMLGSPPYPMAQDRR